MTRPLAELERDAFLAQAESLAQLTRHPGWAAFDELIASMRGAALEHMAQARAEEFSYWQGVVAALREIRERPVQVVLTARSVMDDEADQKRDARLALDGVAPGEDDL